MTTAVVLATAPGADAGPAAALPWEDGTVLRRLLEQLAQLGIASAHVLTRPGWEQALRPSLDGLALSARLEPSESTGEDLRAVATIARECQGGLIVVCGDIVTHREALAGLLADPRIATGVLTTTRRIGRTFAFRARALRGRVVSAASAYHAVRAPNARFLGVLKVAAADRVQFAEVSDVLAELTTPSPPPSWAQELESKAGNWRLLLANLAQAGNEDEQPAEPGPDEGGERPGPQDVVLSGDDEAEHRRWLAVASQDASSLLLVGLVRSGVHVGMSHLRDLFWARPLSAEAAGQAAGRITGYDEDRVLLDSAVKANDGFFTTFFVSPYSKYLARWAARRGWTPNQVTTVSLAIGVLAAAAFATGGRGGLIVGAVLVQLSFTTDCVDGQLARYTRQFSRLGAWLDSVFDRTKEYMVFAGLAIGASRAGHPVWVLAGCALALQTVRHSVDFSYPVTQHQALASAPQPPIEQPWDGLRPPSASPAASARAPAEPAGARAALRRGFALWRVIDRLPGVRWVKKMFGFPIGERFAVISLTAALFTPRTTFVVLLAWGGAATVYKVIGRVLRSILR